MNDSEHLIRDAVHELAAAAPDPGAYSDVAHARDRSHSPRWIMAAVASLLITASVAAVVAVRSAGEQSIDTIRSGQEPTAAPTPADSSPTTTPLNDPSGLSLTIPSGSFAVGRDDVVGLTSDGAMVLVRFDSDIEVQRSTLLDVASAGSSQITRIAGVVDGTLLFGSYDGITESVMALTAPGARPIVLAEGMSGPWLSGDGKRLAAVDDLNSRIVVWNTDRTPGVAIDREVVDLGWTPDGSGLIAVHHDAPLTWVDRLDVDTGYRSVQSIERSRARYEIAGFDPSGYLVVSYRADEQWEVRTLTSDRLELVGGQWDRNLALLDAFVSLSPDGTRLITVGDDRVAVIESLDSTTTQRLAGFQRAWLVPTLGATSEVTDG
jgi:hypothetical protein